LPQILKFGGFELVPSTYELRRGTRAIKIEKLAMELLLLLVSRRESLVSREEIAERLWGKDVYVDAENGVNTAIRKIRKALADNSHRPKFVQRVPGKGYRFIAPVSEENRPAVSSQKRMMLAVLPFANYGRDSSEDYFCDGMTEETIASLGAICPENLGVIARTSSMAYRNTAKPISQIGKELCVGYILESSVRREADRIRITAQLIRVEDQTHVWAANYDRERSTVLGVQAELGRAIAEQVLAGLPGRFSPRVQTANLDAFDLYLKGRYYFAQRSKAGITRAIDFYNQSLALDASYSLANAGLADAYATLPITSDYASDNCRILGLAAANKAVAQDENSAEAHTALAACSFWLTWDWDTAIEAARRAVELNPSYPLAHFYLAHIFSSLCRHDEAEEEMRRAHELDPFSAHLRAIHGQMLYQAGHYDAAAVAAQRAIALNPASWLGHMILAKAQIESGDFQSALISLQQAFDLSGGNSEALAWKVFALVKLGELVRAKEIVEVMKETAKTRHVPAYNLALACNGLGDYNQAFVCLQLGSEQNDVRMRFLPVDPRWRQMNREDRVRGLWPPPQQHLAIGNLRMYRRQAGS